MALRRHPLYLLLSLIKVILLSSPVESGLKATKLFCLFWLLSQNVTSIAYVYISGDTD